MDDLSRLLVQHPQPGARFGQGTLREWNPETFEHAIEWRGLLIRDATILAGVDALTWQPGDQVLLLGADQSGRRGWTDWMVLGRAIVPGPGAAELAIASLRTSLGRAVAAEVFADRIHIASAPGQINPTSSSFVLDDPTINDVEITDARCMIVMLSATLTSNFFVESPTQARMSFEVSGASSISAGAVGQVQLGGSDPDDVVGNSFASMTRAVVVTADDGLNPGMHTIQAAYAAGSVSLGSQISDRSLTVIAF